MPPHHTHSNFSCSAIPSPTSAKHGSSMRPEVKRHRKSLISEQKCGASTSRLPSVGLSRSASRSDMRISSGHRRKSVFRQKPCSCEDCSPISRAWLLLSFCAAPRAQHLRASHDYAVRQTLAAQGWVRRWWSILAVAVQRGVCSAALGTWSTPTIPGDADAILSAGVLDLGEAALPSR